MISEFVKVCSTEEIPDGESKVFELEGKPVLVAKYNGEYYAIDNICSHDGGDLGAGHVIDGQVECPRHGARFDVTTGNATRMPAAFGVEKYDLKVEDGFVFISIED